MVKRDGSGGVDLGDSVELTHLRMEKQWEGDASLDTADGEVVTIYGGGGRAQLPEDVPLSEVIARINERHATNLSETDLLFTNQIADDIVQDEQVQVQALANAEDAFSVGFDKTWMGALTGRLSTNEKFAFELLDNSELRAALVEEYRPDIYKRARVARQRTCPIGDLIKPDGETRFLEYKSTLRWDVKRGEKASYLEDSVVKTIAGFANSRYGGTLLVGVADDGTIHGLEDDYATFSKRGERGDHDLWGQHLKNLLDRLGKSAASLVDWEFFTIDGKDICRISIDPSDHPVHETTGGEQIFWWRTPVGTDPVTDPAQRDLLIARRWGT
ncbi:MAG: ATP-binding protein [Actinomycetota bacterium]